MNMQKTYHTRSEAETERLGNKFAQEAIRGRVVALIGPLGAGKTVFVKGFAKGLGVGHLIQSTTFVLMKAYPITHGSFRTLVHVDCYRIRGEHDMHGVGLTDYVKDACSVVVIEWADRIAHMIPHDAAMIYF